MRKIFLILVPIFLIGFLFYFFLILPMGTKKFSFEDLLKSCNLNSNSYVACYEKGNSVQKVEDESALPSEVPIVIKVNISSLSAEKQSYFICISDSFKHLPFQMPNYFSDDMLMSGIYSYPENNEKTTFVSTEYNSSKSVVAIFACSKRLSPNPSYIITTYGLTPKISSNQTLGSMTLFSISVYPDGNYENIFDFANNGSASKMIFLFKRGVFNE